MDLIFVFLIFVIAFFFVNTLKKELNKKQKINLYKLMIYHFIVGAYYCYFVQGDAIGHWQIAKLMNYDDFIFALTQQGSYFTRALNYFPANVLGLSYFAGTMMYSLLGFMGICYFYVIALKLIPFNSSLKGYHLFPLVFFLPNLHFWSCAVGKDTILFFSIAIFCYGLVAPLKRIPLLALALVLSYFIRPHITLFLLVAFGGAYYLGGNIKGFQRFLLGALFIGLAIYMIPQVIEFTKMEELSVESFEQFSTNKAEALSRSHTASSIDISSYSFPLKVFAFLFRPFFFDINGVPSIIASFENLLLLILSVKVLRYKPLKIFKNSPFLMKGLVFFLGIGTLAFSQTLGNIGIMIRMRNMFLPGMLIYILWALSYQYQLKNKVAFPK